MKKIGTEQLHLLRQEIIAFADTRVMGGFEESIEIWNRHSDKTGDFKADYIRMGVCGWAGYVYRKYIDVEYIWQECKFHEVMSLKDFYMVFDSLWVSTASKLIKERVCTDSDELAY